MTDSSVLDAVAEAKVRVPNALRALQDLYRYTDDELAQLLGLSRSSLRERVAGITQGTPAELAGYAEVFGVEVDTFFLEPAEAVARVSASPRATALLNDRFLAKASRRKRRTLKPSCSTKAPSELLSAAAA